MAIIKRSPPKVRGPHRGGYRSYPPVDNCSPPEWAWRTRSPVYRRKIKRSVQAVNAYLRLMHGPLHRGVTGTQRDFCHFMLDALHSDGERRNRRDNTSPSAEVATAAPSLDATPTNSLTY